MQACKDGLLDAKPVLMVSNNKNAKALEWANEEGLSAVHTSGTDDEICALLEEHDADLVLLSGYMKLIGPRTLAAFPQAVVNVHPALLPKYGGKGMYGSHVHAAVKEAGDDKTGITIHYVDEIYDNGAIIAQKEIALSPEDSPADIETKVKSAEQQFYVETLKKILSSR